MMLNVRWMCLAGAYAVEIIGFMVSGQKAKVQESPAP
jgi:hypothetical protein